MESIENRSDAHF
jgi:hypothetical protein